MNLKCTYKFFENDLFEYKLAPLEGFKHYYQFPVIKTWDKNFFSKKENPSKELKEQYKQGFITHELCHIFKNYLNGDYDKLKLPDHGMTYKSYVTKADMISEIETAALQEFILQSSRHKPISDRGEFFKALKGLNDTFSRPPMTHDAIARHFRKAKRKVRKLGIATLKNEFDAMIEHLRNTP